MAFDINDTSPRDQYVASAAQTVFTVSFEFLNDSDLKVYKALSGVDPSDNSDILTLSSDYTVIGAGSNGVKTVTLNTGAAAGDVITIIDDGPLDRDTEFLSNGDLTIASMNLELNKIITLLLQLEMNQENRSFMFQRSEQLVGVSVVLPAPEANTALMWNATADALVTGLELPLSSVTVTPYMETLLDDTTAAEARATLALDIRETLQANRNYYVRTNGNDSNTGLVDTAGGAFLTIQKAIDTIAGLVDLGEYDITINVSDGTYNGGAILTTAFIGDGTVTLSGNTTTPANCIIDVTGGDCIALTNAAILYVEGFKLTTTTSGIGIKCWLGSYLTYESMDFGACAASHIDCGQNSTVIANGTYDITGSAVSHLHVGSPGLIIVSATAVTLTGSPAFSAYFVGVAQGTVINTAGTVYTGAATGKRFLAHKNGTIDVGTSNGLTYFPGDVAGDTNTLGIYYGNDTPIVLRPVNQQPTELVVQSRHFNNQTSTDRFKTTSEPLGGFGYFFCNGEDCFSSGATHFANNIPIVVGSGTDDGWSFNSSNLVGAGGWAAFNASADAAEVGNMRRRTSDGALLNFFRDTTSVGSISVTTTNTAYNTTSDYRLKDNIKPIENIWDRFKNYKPCQYEFKAEPGKTVTGFIAHELQEVCPQSVTGEKDAEIDGKAVYQQIDQSKIIADLTAALQEAMQRIETLEAKHE